MVTLEMVFFWTLFGFIWPIDILLTGDASSRIFKNMNTLQTIIIMAGINDRNAKSMKTKTFSSNSRYSSVSDEQSPSEFIPFVIKRWKLIQISIIAIIQKAIMVFLMLTNPLELEYFREKTVFTNRIKVTKTNIHEDNCIEKYIRKRLNLQLNCDTVRRSKSKVLVNQYRGKPTINTTMSVQARQKSRSNVAFL